MNSREAGVIHPHQRAACRRDPQGVGRIRQQRLDSPVAQFRLVLHREDREADTIKPREAGGRTHPPIAVGRLRQCRDRAVRQPLVRAPRFGMVAGGFSHADGQRQTGRDAPAAKTEASVTPEIDWAGLVWQRNFRSLSLASTGSKP